MNNKMKLVNYFKTTIIILSMLALNYAKAQENKPKIAEGIIEYHDLFNTSMKDSVACYRIPTVVTAPNGDLVAVIDERVHDCGDLNTNMNSNIAIRISVKNPFCERITYSFHWTNIFVFSKSHQSYFIYFHLTS